MHILYQPDRQEREILAYIQDKEIEYQYQPASAASFLTFCAGHCDLVGVLANCCWHTPKMERILAAAASVLTPKMERIPAAAAYVLTFVQDFAILLQ